MSEDIRCFIAITLDTRTKSIIEKIQQDLSDRDLSVRWVKPEIAHITLKFLGAVPLNHLETVRLTIRECLIGCQAFSFALSRLGAYPNLHRPNVVWLGIDDPDEHIETLVDRLEDQLTRIGFKREQRVFHSHVTIGRFKEEIKNASLAPVMEKYEVQNHTQPCRQITLFKSTLHPCGPQYDALETFQLTP